MACPGFLDIAVSLVDFACGSRCSGCGRRGVATPCAACRDELDRLVQPEGAAWTDVGAARRLVRTAKYGHWRRGGVRLATLAAARLPTVEVDVVTWVPADRTRRAQRGGHLPESIARTWALTLGVPCVQLLRRIAGPTQQGLDRAQRRRNVADAWRVEPGMDAMALLGTRILLVDDVRTTDATLDSAARELVLCGAVVQAFALVRHDHATGLRENPARCEEFSLTNGVVSADSVQHDRRKDAPRVRKPRPP